MTQENKYSRLLLESAQAGNNAALEQLFELNLGRIYALSHRLIGNQPDAEKLASRVFVEAWKNINTFKTYIPFSKSLLVLNINTALHQLKESEEESRKEELAKKKRFRKKNELEKEPDPRLNPTDIEICKLPHPERFSFVLNKIENYSINELADLLRLSPAEIEQHIKNADDKLMNLEFIQTPAILDKKISELPREIKGDNQIITDALSEIYTLIIKEKGKQEGTDKPATESVNKKREIVREKNIRPERVKKIRTADEIASIKKLTTVGVVSLLVIVAIFLFISLTTIRWEVQKLSGSVSIENDLIQDSENLLEGETVKTDAGSSAGISIPDIGYVEVEGVSSFKRLDKKNNASITRGMIKADFSNAEDLFTINVPGGSIRQQEKKIKNIFTVEVDEYGKTKIFVNNGWLFVKDKKNEVFIPTNYSLAIYKETGCGLPYHKDASPELIDAIENYTFTSRSELFVDKIVSLSALRETITLWNLLKRVRLGKRILVYQKLNELAPHPALIKREDLLNLDEQKLQMWLEEIKANL